LIDQLARRESNMQDPTAYMDAAGRRNYPYAVGPARARLHLGLEGDLKDAIDCDGISLHYQPQFEVHSGRCCGIEALARWVSPGGSQLSPKTFIPLAERAELIHPLGAWVLKRACCDAAVLRGDHRESPTVSVNVSPIQIDHQFCENLEATLEATGMSARRLELEITETALIVNMALTFECLKRWRALGVRIALDDFGVGYSNLNYLCRLPIDRLKLDRSLVQRSCIDRKAAAVIRAIISLGAELGVQIIAEGVETEAQFLTLRDLGCTQVQGFLLARPMEFAQARFASRRLWGDRCPAEVSAA
jgi:EAL domain-containing protein (putative c-di-GMP-specific phosphodiesterase class I)